MSYGLTLGHRTEEGKTFMNGEIARLRGLLTSDWSSPSVHAALGSFYAKLARWPSALTHLQTAVALDGSGEQTLWFDDADSTRYCLTLYQSCF